MSLENMMLSEISHYKKTNMYDSTYKSNLEWSNSIESRMVLSGAGGGKTGSCLRGREVLFCKVKRVLETGCMTV